MPSGNADFVEPPDGSLLRTPRHVTRNGRAVPVCRHAQIFGHSTCSSLSGKLQARSSGFCSVCARQEMEGYPAFRDLKYRATRTRIKKVLSVLACVQLDGKELNENVAVAYTYSMFYN